MYLHWGVYAVLLAQRLAAHGLARGEDAWPLWANAMAFGFFSAVSLPIGAACGILFSPVPQAVVAGWLAFGSGCLLFAVTVELYGEALTELEHDGYVDGSLEICVTVAFAIVGAWGYIMLNRWMEKLFSHPDTHGPEPAHPMEKKPLLPGKPQAAVSTTALIAMGKMQKARGRNKAVLKALHDHHVELEGSSSATKIPSPSSSGKAAAPAAAAAAPTTAEKTKEGEHGLMLAMAMFLGVLVDGIPESILLGFLAAERRLSLALVISLFIANFPESFSSGSLMREAGIPGWKIIGMWTSLFLMTGCLAGFACWCLPQDGKGFHSGDNQALHIFGAMIEGLAGGAMLACIASVMLPEAFEMRGDIIGLLCVIGFLLTVMIKVFGGYASEITGGREKTAPIHGGHHGGHHFLAPF